VARDEIGLIRIGGVMPALALLRQAGIDPLTLAAESGLRPCVFDEADNAAPLIDVGRFVALAAQRLACPHFGLLMGTRERLANLGRVGFIVRHSPDLATALANLARYLPYNQRGGRARLRIESGSALLTYTLARTDFAGAEIIVDVSITAGLGFLRTLCGPDFVPEEVTLQRAAPADPAPYRQALGDTLCLGATENAIRFSARWLAHPIEGAEPELCRLLEEDLQRSVPYDGPDFAEDVRRAIRTHLGTGGCSARFIAGLFRLHERTLHRRLARRGLSYHALLDEVRHQAALRLLAATGTSVTRIALLLDYSETSAFSRAFRRWRGVSPAQWRARATEGSPRSEVAETA
jgi:AraC-like DNA-binding protein